MQPSFYTQLLKICFPFKKKNNWWQIKAAPVSAGRLIVTSASSNNNRRALIYVGDTRETSSFFFIAIISTDLEKNNNSGWQLCTTAASRRSPPDKNIQLNSKFEQHGTICSLLKRRDRCPCVVTQKLLREDLLPHTHFCLRAPLSSGVYNKPLVLPRQKHRKLALHSIRGNTWNTCASSWTFFFYEPQGVFVPARLI